MVEIVTHKPRAPRMAAFEPDGPPPDAASYEQLLALVRYRRSVRTIDQNRDVPDELIDKVLELARWAPSAGNVQPWEFVVVRDEEMRTRIYELYARQMEEKREMQVAVWGNSRHIGYSAFKRAPVLIIMLCDPRTSKGFPIRTQLDKGEEHLVSSMANTTVLLHHAIASLGLGSQWVSDVGSPYMSTMLKSWLDIPQHMRVYDMTGVGYPARMPEPPIRRPFKEVVHRERYDRSLERSVEAIDEFLFGYTRLGWAAADTHDDSGAE